MRPKGTREQLAEQRAQGLSLLARGRTPKEVAEILGVTRRSVNRWDHEARHPKKKKKASRPVGRPSKLSDAQLKRLEKALEKGAYHYGYSDNCWTLDRIAQVIWQLFEERYEKSAVWHVMHRMGWSRQRPQRRPFQRDDDVIEEWREEELLRIKKVSTTGRYPRS